MPATENTADALPRFLGLRDVEKLTGLDRVTIWRMRQRGEFPAFYKIGGRKIGVLERDLAKWMLERPKANAA